MPDISQATQQIVSAIYSPNKPYASAVIQPGTPTLVRSAAQYLACCGDRIITIPASTRRERELFDAIAGPQDPRLEMYLRFKTALDVLQTGPALVVLEGADTVPWAIRNNVGRLFDQAPQMGLVLCTQKSPACPPLGSRISSVVTVQAPSPHDIVELFCEADPNLTRPAAAILVNRTPVDFLVDDELADQFLRLVSQGTSIQDAARLLTPQPVNSTPATDPG